MTGNTFTIYSSWEMRKESPALIGKRMLQCIDALSEISPLFAKWWLVNLALTEDEFESAGPDAAGYPLDEVRSRMTEIVEQGVDGGAENRPSPETGFGVSALNSPLRSAKSVSLSVHAGDGVNVWGSRDAVFSTEYGEIPDPSIVAYPTFRSVLETLAAGWDVDYAQAYSSDLMKHWNQPRRYFELSWMTYLSPKLAGKISPPNDVVVERIGTGGILMIAAEETFDAANPAHLAAAHTIRDALLPLNVVEEGRLAQRWSR